MRRYFPIQYLSEERDQILRIDSTEQIIHLSLFDPTAAEGPLSRNKKRTKSPNTENTNQG